MAKQDSSRAEAKNWRRTSWSRLRFELAGLAFALNQGKNPEDYAQHLWGQGAVAWMGKASPTAAEYLLREAEAMGALYPSVGLSIVECGEEKGELVFAQGGCLGGWGQERWGVAQSLGLTPVQVCAYCQEAFRLWAGQLGLLAYIGSHANKVCRLIVKRGLED